MRTYYEAALATMGEEMNADTAKQIEHIVGLLLDLSDEERMEVLCQFCVHCGSSDRTCQCWNDE